MLRAGERALTLDEARSFLGERLARYTLPEDLVVVPELPLNGTHKVDRRALDALLARGVRTASPGAGSRRSR